MQEDVITKRIKNNGIEILAPNKDKKIDELYRIIIEELTCGKIIKQSNDDVLSIIKNEIDIGSEGFVLE